MEGKRKVYQMEARKLMNGGTDSVNLAMTSSESHERR